jgi:uncharacterized protein
MSENSAAPATAPSTAIAMTPVRPQGRIVVVDILRGFSVLGILLVNMLGFSGFLYGPADQIEPIHRYATLFIRFVAQAKFYTLFSFLFGWGMSVQLERAARRNARFVSLFVRRLLILLLIGLVHATLIWDGDILVTYAVLGLPLILFRKLSDKALLVSVVICLLIPVLISTPGPAESFQEAYAAATDGLRQEMMTGYQANVYATGTYWEVTVHRWKNSIFGYTQFIYWSTHIFAMFLLGLYTGRHRILHDPQSHLPLLRRVMWRGLIVGGILNLVFVAATNRPSIVPPGYYQLATRGARTIGGSALCLCYVSIIVLLTQRPEWYNRLSPLASVGRMALSNYLLHSVICTLIFNGYGLGLYGRFGPAITIILTFVIYRVQISTSGWWLDRFRFGPAEWLWRSLTYGKLQSLALERGQRSKTRPRVSPAPSPQPAQRLPGWLAFLLRRLLFIAAVSVAIVYFCTLGMRLSVNSSTSGRPLNAWDQVEPALQGTVDFFEGAFHGDLGHVGRGVAQRTYVPVTELLAETYAKSASLVGISIAFSTLVGIAVGGLAATRRHSAMSFPALTLTLVGVSIPSFFLALLFQIGAITFYQRTGIRLMYFGPRLGRSHSLLPPGTLPALVLAARPLAHITRVTFVSISDIMQRDFIRTARAKGLDPRIVFWRHALRNAGVSIFTAIVVSLRFALGSLPVVEVFFNWPGLGVTMLNAIYARETRTVTALALSLGLTFLIVNMASDLIYLLIDPRLRTPGNGGES